MTNKEAKKIIYMEWQKFLEDNIDYAGISEAYKTALKALDQEPCNDEYYQRTSIQDITKAFQLGLALGFGEKHEKIDKVIDEIKKVIAPQLKIGHCKDCKWWRDSDGLYRRGSHAESKCPINRREVFEGNGYCYMFDPKESEG